MLWYIVKGGPVMIPILLGSILGLAIIMEKLWLLHKSKIDVDFFTKHISMLLHTGKYQAAIEFCSKYKNKPIAIVFKAGIEKHELPPHQLEKLLERVGNAQVHNLEKYIGGLISIIGIEPLLGFLGTITGLIKAFMAWEKAGPNITVSILAGGMYEAMITTAAGLIVAVPFYLICNYIISRTKYISFQLSDYSSQLVDMLVERQSVK